MHCQLLGYKLIFSRYFRLLCVHLGNGSLKQSDGYLLVLQRVMEQRVDNVLVTLLPRSPLTNPFPMEEGGNQQVVYLFISSLSIVRLCVLRCLVGRYTLICRNH